LKNIPIAEGSRVTRQAWRCQLAHRCPRNFPGFDSRSRKFSDGPYGFRSAFSLSLRPLRRIPSDCNVLRPGARPGGWRSGTPRAPTRAHGRSPSSKSFDAVTSPPFVFFLWGREREGGGRFGFGCEESMPGDPRGRDGQTGRPIRPIASDPPPGLASQVLRPRRPHLQGLQPRDPAARSPGRGRPRGW